MSKTDIFFSYANEDKGRVARLVVALEAGGWSVFWDRRIPAGQTWRSHIGRALEQARCVVVAWSEHSIQSEWVIEEADDGRERGILVPAFLDPVRPPRGFRAIQAADLSGWSPEHPSPAFESFLADLGAVLGAPHSEPSTISPVSEVSPVKHGLGEQDEPATTLQQGAGQWRRRCQPARGRHSGYAARIQNAGATGRPACCGRSPCVARGGSRPSAARGWRGAAGGDGADERLVAARRGKASGAAGCCTGRTGSVECGGAEESWRAAEASGRANGLPGQAWPWRTG